MKNYRAIGLRKYGPPFSQKIGPDRGPAGMAKALPRGKGLLIRGVQSGFSPYRSMGFQPRLDHKTLRHFVQRPVHRALQEHGASIGSDSVYQSGVFYKPPRCWGCRNKVKLRKNEMLRVGLLNPSASLQGRLLESLLGNIASPERTMSTEEGAGGNPLRRLTDEVPCGQSIWRRPAQRSLSR